MAWGAAVVAAVQLGLSLYQAFSGSSGAKALDKAYSKNTIFQAQNAVKNFSQQANANNSMYAQEQESAYQKSQQVYLDNLQAKATAQASAASSGITGQSIENLFKGYDRANAINNFISERNLRNLGLQYDANYEALRTNAINSIYGIPQYTGATQSSALLSGMGQIIPAGVNAYNSINSARGK